MSDDTAAEGDVTAGEGTAAPTDPPLDSPAEPTTRLVQWIGEPPRFITRKTKDGKTDRSIDYEFEREREAPTPNHSVRSLRPASLPGLTRTYHWGPQWPFIAEMIASDAELVLSSSEGAKFRDVTDETKLGKHTMKSLLKDGKIRRLNDPLHQRSADWLKSRGLA